MAIDSLKPVFSRVVEQGQQLQRFRTQGAQVLTKLENAKTPDDLAALTRFVGSTIGEADAKLTELIKSNLLSATPNELVVAIRDKVRLAMWSPPAA